MKCKPGANQSAPKSEVLGVQLLAGRHQETVDPVVAGSSPVALASKCKRDKGLRRESRGIKLGIKLGIIRGIKREDTLARADIFVDAS
jgi:hypothetical protein